MLRAFAAELRRRIYGSRHRLSITPIGDGSRSVDGARPRLRLCSDRGKPPVNWVLIEAAPADLSNFTLFVERAGAAADMQPLAIRTLPALLRLPHDTSALYLRCSAAAEPPPTGDLVVRELGGAAALRELVRPYVGRLRRDPALGWHFAQRVLATLLGTGARGLYQTLASRVPRSAAQTYGEWIRHNDTLTAAEEARIRQQVASFATRAEIAVMIAVEQCTAAQLDRSIHSVRDQIYTHWQLWLVPIGSPPSELRDVMRRHREDDPRVRILPDESATPRALNAALAAATAPRCARLEANTALAPHALYLLAAELDSHPDTVMIYGDDDHFDECGARRGPRFKSRWNPDLLLSEPYLGPFTLYETDRLRRLHGWQSSMADGADWDLALRVSGEAADQVRHVPFLLCHRAEGLEARDVPGVSAAAARRVLEAHVTRHALQADVVETEPERPRIRYRPAASPLVSILMPTCNRVEYLKACIESLRRTTYPHYELLIVDNGSENPAMLEYLAALASGGAARVLRFPHPFNFSAINNLAAGEARGSVLALLNDDVEVIDPEWLTEMTSHALRAEVGAVGAKLYYPDGSIQHAGLVLGLGGIAGHAYRGLAEGAPPADRSLSSVREVAAVSAACLVIRAELYHAVGGLDEQHLGIAFNDVDLCLKLRQRGYRIIWTPHARLYHHESVTRGRLPDAAMARRFRREERTMRRRWRAALSSDPFCNPNLALTDPLLPPSFDRRVEKPWRRIRARPR